DLNRSLRGESVSARTGALPYGLRVWLRTRLKVTARIAMVAAATTLLVAYLILAVPLRAAADNILGVYVRRFPDLAAPAVIEALGRLVPAGLGVGFEEWAVTLAVFAPLLSLARGPLIARLARPAGGWDDLVTGLIAGAAASTILIALLVPVWMVMLGLV